MEANVLPISYLYGKIFNYVQNIYEMKWSGVYGGYISGGMGEV